MLVKNLPVVKQAPYKVAIEKKYPPFLSSQLAIVLQSPKGRFIKWMGKAHPALRNKIATPGCW
jgi:hypothetical protein